MVGLMKIYWMKATLILLAICGLILWRFSADRSTPAPYELRAL